MGKLESGNHAINVFRVVVLRERIGDCQLRIGLPDAQYASGLVAARSGLLHPSTRTGDCPWRIGVPDVQYASGLVAARRGLVSPTLNTRADWWLRILTFLGKY